MKQTFSSTLGLLLAGWLTAAAFSPTLVNAQVHAPYAPFATTVNPSSTIFNTQQGFNGSVAGFGGSWGFTNPSPGEVSTTGTQYFSATFDADPGSVFTGVSMGFEGWSFANPENSWVGLWMGWKITAGSDSFSSATGVNPDTSGPFMILGGPQGGGGGLGLPIVPITSPLSLNNVSTFTLEIEAAIWAGGPGYFGDGYGAGLGFGRIDVGTLYAEGSPPPVITPIPEPEIYAMMGFGLGLLGWVARRRKRNAG